MLSSRLTGLQLADAPAALPKQSYGAHACVQLLLPALSNLTGSPCQPAAQRSYAWPVQTCCPRV